MIINTHELRDLRSEHQDASIALRLGCYDLLHRGHQEGIDFAASQADILVVGVMPDEYIRKFKGPDRPINSEDSRVAYIDQIDAVDYSLVVKPSVIGLAGIFRSLRPDTYVEGHEHGFKMLKSLQLNYLGIDCITDNQNKIGSTTSMIAELGLARAIANSGANYLPM